MASALRIDPLGVFNFYLTLIDTSNVVGTLITAALNYKVAGFSECSGLEATVEVFEYREGGLNDHVHKFPTRATHANLTLKHGVIYLYDDLWTWHYDFVQGKGKRKDGLIVLLDEAKNPAKVWKFKRGIPMKWMGPALNAAQNNVAIESLEIAHEGLILEVGA
jgi:phage tail-like protein